MARGHVPRIDPRGDRLDALAIPRQAEPGDVGPQSSMAVLVAEGGSETLNIRVKPLGARGREVGHGYSVITTAAPRDLERADLVPVVRYASMLERNLPGANGSGGAAERRSGKRGGRREIARRRLRSAHRIRRLSSLPVGRRRGGRRTSRPMRPQHHRRSWPTDADRPA
jgi:hypothetical protein